MSRMFARSDFEKISFLSISWGQSFRYIILWNLVEESAAHTLLAAMLKHVTLSFCVMRMLLKVIWSPGLDMQSSQGIHCRNSMLTCTNTTITTPAIVALLFKWWTYFRKYSKAGQIFLMCNKTGKKAECSSERRDEKISYFLAGVAGTSWHVNNYIDDWEAVRRGTCSAQLCIGRGRGQLLRPLCLIIIICATNYAARPLNKSSPAVCQQRLHWRFCFWFLISPSVLGHQGGFGGSAGATFKIWSWH